MNIPVCVTVLLLLVAPFQKVLDATSQDGRAVQLQRDIARPTGLGEARGQLKEILKAPEFAEKMRQATAWDRWKRQFGAWLLEHFGRIIKSITQHPVATETVFWIGTLGSLAVIAFYLFRLFRGSTPALDQISIRNVTASHSAEEWIAAARAAADCGELQKGIQCSYWAAIACLQSAGRLPISGGHTPREFLAALRIKGPAENLRDLTSALERFWYGRLPATIEDFAACLRSVEALGCKLQ